MSISENYDYISQLEEGRAIPFISYDKETKSKNIR